MLNLALKSLEGLNLDKIQGKRQNRRSQATAFKAGRFKFQKRRGFLKGERGRQAVVYIEGDLVVGLVFFQVIIFV